MKVFELKGPQNPQKLQIIESLPWNLHLSYFAQPNKKFMKLMQVKALLNGVLLKSQVTNFMHGETLNLDIC